MSHIRYIFGIYFALDNFKFAAKLFLVRLDPSILNLAAILQHYEAALSAAL